MNRFTAILAACFMCMPLFLASCATEDKSVIYYVDSVSGNDVNAGTSMEQAFRSVKALEEKTLKGGDKILIKGGTTVNGKLSFLGEGSEEEPIVIGSYGEGVATIDGNGQVCAISLNNQSNVVIENLSVKNTDTENIGGMSKRSGIAVSADSGIVGNITIRNCVVSDVHGTVYGSEKYNNAGIIFQYAIAASDENHFEDLLVENCTVKDVYGTGIRLADHYAWPSGYDAMNPPPGAINPFNEIVIRKSVIERTGGDGIVLQCADKPLIEDVGCFDAGYYSDSSTYSIAGVWTCGSYSPTFRRVEVARTKFIELDGTAFDTDWGNTGTATWEYCYTHDNEGGVLLRHKSMDCVMRYCISVNDGKEALESASGEQVDPRGLIWHASVSDDYNSETLRVYNCVFYADAFDMIIARGPYYGASGFLFNGDYDTPTNTFTNCIFVSRNQVNWGSRMKLQNNAYYVLGGTSVKPERDTLGIAGDPLFAGNVEKDASGMIADRSDPAKYFTLQSASPLIGAGIALVDSGGKDYAGNELGIPVCIGAFEYQNGK